MRILQLLDTDQIAGTEVHVVVLAAELAAIGCQVTLGCYAGTALHRHAIESGVDVLALNCGRRIWRAITPLIRFVKERGVEVIHAHNGRTMGAAAAVGSMTKARLVATQHFIHPHHVSLSGPKAAVLGTAHSLAAGRFTYFIAISDAVREAMVRRREVDPARISVVPNGVKLHEASKNGSADSVRKTLGIEKSRPLVLYLGRLESEKDVYSLVTAIALVKAAVPECICVIAGEGAQRAQLEAHARGLNTGDSIRFLGFRSDGHALLDAADLLVLPSPEEPFGLVLLEAMAAGKPVIAVRQGGPLDIVVHRTTGFLVAPRSAAEIASAIVELVKQPELRESMGASARQRFLDHFTARKMALLTKEVYLQALTPS